MFGSGEVEANAAELSLLQDALDAMIAHNHIAEVAPQTDPTSIFTALPNGPGAESLSPTFIRVGNNAIPTRCSYVWAGRGVLFQSSCDPSGAALLILSCVACIGVMLR